MEAPSIPQPSSQTSEPERVRPSAPPARELEQTNCSPEPNPPAQNLAASMHRELSREVNRIRSSIRRSSVASSTESARWPPGTRERKVVVKNENPVERISEKLASYSRALDSPNIIEAQREIPNCTDVVERLRKVMDEVDTELGAFPTIEVAFLGPSRHGKSTLLNALACCSILPMSDIKPCTASIVSLRWDAEWQMHLKFVTPRKLDREKQQAIQDADEYLARVREGNLEGEQPDDPRYLKSLLQRFLTLYGLDSDESPERLVDSVRNAVLPDRIGRLLGQKATPKSQDLNTMQGLVDKYLSTKDVYWTILDSCEIAGPFEGWHRQLRLLDLPGTNDTDPHRTRITNRLRERARAVAICTSDSNLGPDIESWLQNSTVMSDFLEATEGRQQRLIILRTKFDSYHPEIDEDLIDDNDDESEDRLYREAIARHKHDQTESYQAMLRDIASPKLPFGESEAAQRKRDEMLARLGNIPVFFVSALAHEVFAGRYNATRRTKRNLSEHFGNDTNQTGIPEVREYLSNMAEEHLAQNYYDDMERKLDKEVDLLVRFFRRSGKLLNASLSDGGASFGGLIERVEQSVIP